MKVSKDIIHHTERVKNLCLNLPVVPVVLSSSLESKISRTGSRLGFGGAFGGALTGGVTLTAGGDFLAGLLAVGTLLVDAVLPRFVLRVGAIFLLVW